MKKALSTLAILSVTIPAFATLALYEPFAGPTGTIEGQSPAMGGTWVMGGPVADRPTQAPMVVHDSLTVPGLAPSSGGALQHLNGNTMAARVGFVDGTYFSPPATVGEVGAPLYYSLALKVTDLTGLHSGGGALFGFGNGTAASTTVFSSYGTRFYIMPGIDADHYTIGLAKNGVGGALQAPEVVGTVNYAVGETIFVVGSYTQVGGGGNAAGTGNDSPIKLWINPDSSTFGGGFEATVPESSTFLEVIGSTQGDIGAPAGGPYIISFEVRQHASIASTPSYIVDELRVGTTWAAVTPIPEPGTVALSIIAGLALLARRRFRSAI